MVSTQDRSTRSRTRSPRAVSLVFVVVLVLLHARPVAAELPSAVTIGVISPRSGGRSAGAGDAHEEAIKQAMNALWPAITVDGHAVRIEPVYEDDRAVASDAVAAARRLVANGAVAILGPVNSESTRAVLAAGLEVPILSSLSTAPDLTQPRDPWFFRATVDDRARMQRYARFLEENDVMKGAFDVFLYEDDAYGQGLKDSLRTELHPDDDDFGAIAWPAMGGEEFAASVLSSLPERRIRLFILGTEERGAATAGNIERLLSARGGHTQDIGFFFVGNPHGFFDRVPEGSLFIGEPLRERDPSDDSAARPPEATVKRARWSDTTYETAYFVLPRALQVALAEVDDPNDVRALRRAVRDALERETFRSLTPWEKIRFQDGSLQNLPATPVYRVGKSFERVDRPVPARWVRLAVPEDVRWLEAPVEIRLEGHGFADDATIELAILQEPGAKVVEVVPVPLHGGRATYPFAAPALGRFSVVIRGVASDPHSAQLRVVWTFNYLLALVGAVAGSILAIAVRRKSGEPFPTGRLLIGVAIGFGLFGLSTLGQVVPELRSVPLPRFGGPSWLAALCSGALGGWAGPGLLGLLPTAPKG